MPLEVMLHACEDDGSFEASLGHLGSLARRPRGTSHWELHWHEVTHRWSDARWDWALSIQDGGPLPEDALARLQQQLGSSPG
jgi:hypothetical protein